MGAYICLCILCTYVCMHAYMCNSPGSPTFPVPILLVSTSPNQLLMPVLHLESEDVPSHPSCFHMSFLSTEISVKRLGKSSGVSISRDLIFKLLFRQICSGNYLISPSSFSSDSRSGLDGQGNSFQVTADLIHPSSDEENFSHTLPCL